MPICQIRNGYLKTNLFINGKRYSFLIHRLVMREFVGPSSLQVNHIDGDKNNNALSNLEYLSQSDNIRHGFRLGLYSKKGEQNPSAKLTNIQVSQIRFIAESGHLSQRKIATLFHVSQSTISKIVNGRKWQ